MKDRLTQLWELFRTASPATRITLVMSLLALGAVVAGSTWYAGRPDYVQLWSGLSAAEAAEYKSALAQAGIPFRSSPPPENGIWVDASDEARAEAQVALGGYRPSQKGILLADGGAASAFMSARSRQQMADKREWQECELQLESLAFIDRATVTASTTDHSPFGTPAPPTISVTLGLRHGISLDGAQSRTVARLVRSRFNVPLENITVVDERGNLLHDGAEVDENPGGEDLFDQKRRHDADSERRANRALELALGKGMAHVTVNSEWTYDELESIVESALPESSAPYYQSTTKAATQGQDSLGGGPAGVSSNIVQDFGNENAAVGTGGGRTAENRETKETRNVVGRSTEHRRVRTPRITRLSVALIADESVTTNSEQLAAMVKAAVGFEADRGDQFEAFTTSLASVARDAEGNPILPAEPDPVAPPSEYLELAIEHGVELVAALAFIFVLLRSLKSAGAARRTATSTGDAGSEGAEAGEELVPQGGQRIALRTPRLLNEEELAAIDPEVLARAQVEELVRSDPERVTDILKKWATETERLVKA